YPGWVCNVLVLISVKLSFLQHEGVNAFDFVMQKQRQPRVYYLFFFYMLSFQVVLTNLTVHTTMLISKICLVLPASLSLKQYPDSWKVKNGLIYYYFF